MTSPNHDSGKWWARTFDNLLIPIAGALLCLLCVSQVITSIPGVRRVVDGVEGRFVAQPVQTLPDTTHAEMTLYLSPSDLGSKPLVEVLAGNRVLGELSARPLTISVHEGEQLLLQRVNQDQSTFIVSIEYSNPTIIQPISGWSTTLSNRVTMIGVPTIRFAH